MYLNAENWDNAIEQAADACIRVESRRAERQRISDAHEAELTAQRIANMRAGRERARGQLELMTDKETP